MRRTTLRVGLALLTGFFPTTAVFGQVKKGCSSVGGPFNLAISAVPYRPFTGEWVNTSDVTSPQGASRTVITKFLVARDSEGRVRLEEHEGPLPPAYGETLTMMYQDGEKYTVTRDEYEKRVTISDCASGTRTEIRPAERIATVTRDNSAVAPRPASFARFLDVWAPDPGSKSYPPEVLIEQLGTREIQGVETHGVRTTTNGGEKDDDRNGKPVRQTEDWVSDDLQTRLVIAMTDLKTGKGERSEFLDVKREEPDPSLFQIPTTYRINPPRDDMPGLLSVPHPQMAAAKP